MRPRSERRVPCFAISSSQCFFCGWLDRDATGRRADAGAGPLRAQRDGTHDFDSAIGQWRTHLRRLRHPLQGSSDWVEYTGKSTVRSVWNGRANLLELEADGPAGHIEALSLRLYNPDTRQWSLNFSNSAAGVLTTPVIGSFRDGRGEFYNAETLYGRAIFVRFIITIVSADLWRFEQAFSEDGGRTWETNWIAEDTRVH